MVVERYLDGSINPFNIFRTVAYNIRFKHEHPDYFDPDGLLVFCGPQGSGKTLSAVRYVTESLAEYPKAVLCTNVFIKDFSPTCSYRIYSRRFRDVDYVFVDYIDLITGCVVRHVRSCFLDGEQQCNIRDYNIPDFPGRIILEYDGLDTLKDLINGEYGILYFIDEIHLEFNSLESKNIPIEIMIEVSQQRKQRKHIVGTSQIYGRMAKPLREQIKYVVLCTCILRVLQYNVFINGDKTEEVDGKLQTETYRKFIWFHKPEYYGLYDTFAKMKRYRKEWKGRAIQ